MRITDVERKPHFVQVSTPVLKATLDAGKGAVDLMMRIACYFWPNEELLGTAEEFATTLGINRRDWYRYISKIAGLRYVCPHRGTYVLIEFLETAEEIARLKAVKAQVAAAYEAGALDIAKWELPTEVDQRYIAARAQDVAGDDDLAGVGAPVIAPPLDPALAQAARLYEQITGHTLTAMGGEDLTAMLDEFGLEQVRYALEEAQKYQAHSPIRYMQGVFNRIRRERQTVGGNGNGHVPAEDDDERVDLDEWFGVDEG